MLFESFAFASIIIIVAAFGYLICDINYNISRKEEKNYYYLIDATCDKLIDKIKVAEEDMKKGHLNSEDIIYIIQQFKNSKHVEFDH